MDLETENRLASLLLEEARRLQLEADREGVHAYLRKPNVRHRPNSRFLTATVRGVQQANRVVEVNEMWRAREKELELESKMKNRSSRSKNLDDSRGEKRKSDSRNHSSSSRVEQEGIAYSNSYSDQEDGLGDDEIERFLHSSEDVGLLVLGWTSLVHSLICCPIVKTTSLVLTYVWKKNGNAECKDQRSLRF
ncbi:unnamed protein product [Urochloa decumbens]|uniref:Uncharacterized protein n=1 Tax=Urochloa decumbens TaxID=240449 RepID=A0ABC8VQN0_9POAL